MIKNKLKLIAVLIFVYIVLFEFVLPVNKLLPKPSMLGESLFEVWLDYNLLESLAVTTSVIYLSLAAAYLFVYLLATFIIKFKLEFPSSVDSLRIFRYFPAFFFSIIFIYWFENSVLAELLFGFITSALLISFEVIDQTKNINYGYVDVAKNLGISNSKIYSNVILKSIQPYVFIKLRRIHYYLWVLIMIYEFVGKIHGLGGVYSDTLNYRDFTAMFSFAILISILILVGDIILKLIKEKIFSWE